jgi:N-acetylneuraminic acid mutarotase
MAKAMRTIILVSLLLLQFPFQAQFWIQKASVGGVGRHRATGCATSHRGYIGLGHINGTGQDITFKDWWEYDPAADTWTQKADFPIATHGAVAFIADNCPVVGGGSALSTQFYKFNTADNTWAQIANCILPNPGDSQGFTVNNRGFVYQANQLAKYNPNTDSWSLCATPPATFGSWTCSFVIEGSGYIKYGNQLLEYKPLHDQWIQRASFPGNSTGGSSGFAIQQRGYVSSGYVGALAIVTEQVWSFHPATNTWRREIDFPGTSRRFPVAWAIHDRGYFGTGTNGVNLNDFWQFNPIDNTIGIDEITMDLKVYPNPFSNELTINLNGSQGSYPLNVSLVQLNGKVILNTSLLSDHQTFDFAQLPAGPYLLQISKGHQILKQQMLFKQ